MKNFLVLTALSVCVPLAANPQTDNQIWTGAGRESLSATLWANRSAEAKLAYLQTYRAAMGALERGLKDKNWNALPDFGGDFSQKPTAVILDLDETVLDNSPYQARLVRSDSGYTDAGWNGWLQSASAPVLPGAKAFLLLCQARGVKIFYITNRAEKWRAATLSNLQKLGLPVEEKWASLLLKGQKPEWRSDKTPRRAFVAQNYRVLALLGDDLNDFVNARDQTLAQREALWQKNASLWGQKWFVLPNAMYGSWEEAAVDFEQVTRKTAMERRLKALQTRGLSR